MKNCDRLIQVPLLERDLIEGTALVTAFGGDLLDDRYWPASAYRARAPLRRRQEAVADPTRSPSGFSNDDRYWPDLCHRAPSSSHG